MPDGRDPRSADMPPGDVEPAYSAAGERQGEGEPEYVPSWAMRAWHWIAAPPIRPDRSASLDRERTGRLDKLDLWIAVVLLIALLGSRIYRLDEPLGMHFDEVYHARTGTEFLQEWRYNIPHGIYEWTHPHFAKYAIAAGIYLFDDDKVTSTSTVDAPVKDVAIEPRLEPLDAVRADGTTDPTIQADPKSDPNKRFGDRLYVATGNDVRAYDLESRQRVDTFAIPGATAVYMATAASRLYAGTSSGDVYAVDTSQLDKIRLGLAQPSSPPSPIKVASVGFPIAHVYADAQIVLAVSASGEIVSIDPTTSTIVGRGSVPGASDIVSFGTIQQRLVVQPSKIADAAAEASAIAGAVGASQADLRSQLAAAASSSVEVPLNVPSFSDQDATAINDLINQGKLPGIAVVGPAPRVLVAATTGVVALDARHAAIISTAGSDGPVTGLAFASDKKKVYAAAGSSLDIYGVTNDASGQPLSIGTYSKLRMPGAIQRLYYNSGNNILQALGKTQDGSGWTVYAVETNGDAVFSDARLPFQPVAWAADATPRMPNVDREALMLFDGSGNVASVDIGQFAFSWRIVGVIFGAFMVVFLYLLARVLFRRRSVGLIVAALSLLDGMFFVQSRIAMNDTYVGAWLLAAYLLFALVWMGVWRGRSAFWLGMPLIGLCLGLALASKWVGLYAIASIGMLILIRSALGRLITVLGLAAGTGVLGYLSLFEAPLQAGATYQPSFYVALVAAALAAIGGIYLLRRMRTTPDRVLVGVGAGVLVACLVGLALLLSPPVAKNAGPNFAFFLIMLVVTAIAAAVTTYRPISWSREEMWFAIVVPAIAGVAMLALVAVGRVGWSLAGPGAGLIFLPAAAFWIAGRWGFGPLAPPPRSTDPLLFADPPAPAPAGWLRLGSGFGLPAIWMAACILVLPIAVYVAAYIPWAMPWQQQTNQAIQDYGQLPVLMCFQSDANGQCVNGWPNGHTGQTLVQLTQQMYNYHNDLREGHPASSPWWAWPLDLKPVWFESVDYAQETSSRIYDGGNLPMWWLAIPGMAFVCWQAYRRRSLALALVTFAFFWQWLSWSRIDRASFQYHFYTALPFFLLALAYFVAELWHGPSRRTWLLARVAGAITVVGAPLLWLFKLPLCGLARVDLGNGYASEACGGPSVGDVTVTTQIALIAAILVVALIVLAVLLYKIERESAYGEPQGYGWIAQLALPVVAAGALLLIVGQVAPRSVLVKFGLPDQFGAFFVLILLAVLGWVVLTARDPRRFTLGVLVTALLAFIALYPNLSALPLPGNIASAYNGFLPTWLYGFQFGVNLEASQSVKLIDQNSILLTLGVVAVAAVVGYAGLVQRIVIGYRRREELLDIPPDGGPEAQSGGPRIG